VKRLLISRSVTGLVLLSVLAACSVLEEDKVNYKSATKGPSLDVPPDLSQLRRDSRYALESTSASASGFAAASRTVKDAGTATNKLGDVRMERTDTQRWLVVDRPADKVWDSLREFWTSNGFVLTTDEASLGILETDWAENRAKIPQDFIRRSLGKVLDGLYSSGERDRYRTRVERNSSGGVEIYITHRGMVEDYADAQKNANRVETPAFGPRAGNRVPASPDGEAGRSTVPARKQGFRIFQHAHAIDDQPHDGQWSTCTGAHGCPGSCLAPDRVGAGSQRVYGGRQRPEQRDLFRALCPFGHEHGAAGLFLPLVEQQTPAAKPDALPAPAAGSCRQSGAAARP